MISLFQIPDSGVQEPGLKRSPFSRFCWEVRFAKSYYGLHFEKVFENPTFIVYKVLR